MTARAVAALLAVLILTAGCTSLSEQECRTADWQAIGLADGAEGRPVARLEAHARACAAAGIVPDEASWLRGRELGLRRYCTPAQAHALGMAGAGIAEGCTAEERAAMAPAWEHGRVWWEIGLEIAELEADLRAIDRAIAARPPVASVGPGALPGERAAILARILLLEAARARHARWP